MFFFTKTKSWLHKKHLCSHDEFPFIFASYFAKLNIIFELATFYIIFFTTLKNSTGVLAHTPYFRCHSHSIVPLANLS